MCKKSTAISAIDFPVDVFGEEVCPQCGHDAYPDETDIGTYQWRCTICDFTWVRTGSVMGIFNDLHHQTFPDRYEGF